MKKHTIIGLLETEKYYTYSQQNIAHITLPSLPPFKKLSHLTGRKRVQILCVLLIFGVLNFSKFTIPMNGTLCQSHNNFSVILHE